MRRAIIISTALLAAGVMSGRGHGQAVTTNLVAYWPLDTVAATTPDTVGGHTFTNTGTATATTGVVGGAAQLSGSNQYFTAADAAPLNFASGSFTAAAWIRPAGTASVRLLNKWVSGEQGWLLDIHSTTGGTAQVGSLRMRLDSNAAGNSAGVDNIDITVAAGLTSGAWTHVAAVVDRTANQVRLYRDGVQVGATATLPASLGSLSNTAVLGLGTIPASLGKYYAGAVDEVRLYSRALSAAEVLTLVAPAPPVLTAPLTPGYGSMGLTWSAVPGATSYQVYYSTTSGSGYAAFGTGTTGTSQTVTGLTNGTTYYFVVTADNGYAESGYSNQLSGVPVAPPPRTNNHEEGLMDGDCACGSSVTAPLPALPALFAAVLLLRRRRR